VRKIKGIGLGVLGALAGLAGPQFPDAVHAADIVIVRELPTHNVLEQPLPENATIPIAIPTEETDLLLSLVPGPRLLSDGEFGAVVASPPPSGSTPFGAQTDLLSPNVEGARGDGLAAIPGSGMGSFSSLSGMGGQISGQVNGAIGSAMQGLNSALGIAAQPGSQ
jgi:hypothetical protein